jgi:hypothetical protein
MLEGGSDAADIVCGNLAAGVQEVGEELEVGRTRLSRHGTIGGELPNYGAAAKGIGTGPVSTSEGG